MTLAPYLRNLLVFAFATMLFNPLVVAQRITFKTLGGNNITLNQAFPLDLEFGDMVMGSSDLRIVQLNGDNDDRVVVLSFDAPTQYDVTVFVDALNILENLDYIPGPTEDIPSIPFDFRFAFANPGFPTSHTDIIAAKNAAVELPIGFNTMTFPVSKRASGLPAPPPTPEYEGYSVPLSRVYLFLYGTAGPTDAGTNVVGGLYTTEVTIQIQLSSYND